MLGKSYNGLWPKAIKTRPRFTNEMGKRIRRSFTIHIIRFNLDTFLSVKIIAEGHLVLLKHD